MTEFSGDIIDKAMEISPLSGTLLKGAEFDYCEDSFVLNVNLSKHGADILRMSKTDALIEGFVGERAGREVRVILNDPSAEIEYVDDRMAPPMQTPSISAKPPSISAKTPPKPKTSYTKPTGTAKSQKNSNRSSKLAAKELSGIITGLDEPLEEGDDILLEGEIFRFESITTRTGRLMCTMDITDGKDSVTVKFFMKDMKEFDKDLGGIVAKGKAVRVFGKIRYDDYARELTVMASQIAPSNLRLGSGRKDMAAEKRVELHLHTHMSQMDAMNSAADCVAKAAEFGMPAVAITDHGNVQAYPEAYAAGKKHGIKIIYGMEAYLADDLAAIVQNPGGQTLDGSFVAFDIETTGLDPLSDKIIEIGAVKIAGGVITDSFNALINPHMPLPGKIMKLTGITDKDLHDKPAISEVLPEFIKFADNMPLIAHNARFDIPFIQHACDKLTSKSSINKTNICTLELSRALFPELHSHRLNVVAKHCDVALKTHHRGSDDAAACAGIFIKCREVLLGKGIADLKDINQVGGGGSNVKKLPLYHAIILVKNQIGLKNLYELVSLSNIEYFNKRPRIPKSLLSKKREGLILGTACESGELYTAVLNGAPHERVKEIAEFYDYIELQTHKNNMYLVREGKVADESALIAIGQQLIAIGQEFLRPVCATSDVHFINPEGSVFREILMTGEGFKDAAEQAPLYFRTTDEMLDEFPYLSPEKRYEVVIKNTREIADSIEDVEPLPKGSYPIEIEGSDAELKNIVDSKLLEIYGGNPPQVVTDRINREMDSIIKHGFASLYNAARLLTKRSLDNGYLVGSRGSIGSSLSATMSGITEVNPLKAHYYCETCKFSDFESKEADELEKKLRGLSGCDLPDKNCPVCGIPLKKDGHEIAFEVFLGFDCDKEPDIDLNFSGEYQSTAHAHAEEMFGTGHVFKAGTIGTLADKTAFGFVSKFFEEKGMLKRKAEINRMVQGLVGIKRTTGQHPGGVIIVPKDNDIHNFCPIQRPADNQDSSITTTHFDYHSALEGRLMKLDILGHDAPTVLRLLKDTTGVDPMDIDIGDKKIMAMFNGTLEGPQGKIGTLGIPEFGTGFVRQMLKDTKPSGFTELVKISGLSHGTDVWLGNGADLIKNGTTNLNGIVAARDDILINLVNLGMDKLYAFNIMEKVRKGKGLTDEEAADMKKSGCPDWYIDSCRRIKYLFPKGHAVAYVMMSVRIAYYKIHHPAEFYAASFSVKTEDVDYVTMLRGEAAAAREFARVQALGRDQTAKDKNALGMIELCLEAYAAGINFLPIDIYKSHQNRFIPTENGILPPFMTLQGLGGSAAQGIIDARESGEFISRQDFKERTKVSKTVLALFVDNGLLSGLPETNQLTLDGFM